MSKQRFSNKLCKLFSMHSLEIIYVDEDLLIVNKPAGLLAVPGKGPDKADCLLSRICEQFPSTLIVHRLDQATSGLMVFARNALIQRARLFMPGTQLHRQHSARMILSGLRKLIESKQGFSVRERCLFVPSWTESKKSIGLAS